MKVKIYTPDLDTNCKDCMETLADTISELDGVLDYNIRQDFVDIDYDEKILRVEDIISAIKKEGFDATLKYAKPYEKSNGGSMSSMNSDDLYGSTRKAHFNSQNHSEKHKTESHQETTKIYVPDIECESCSRLLTKKVGNINGVEELKINSDSIDIVYNEAMIKPANFILIIEDLGFRASLNPFERKTFGERLRDFRENKKKYAMVTKAISYGIYAFLILVALQALAYFGFLSSSMPDFMSNYASWLIYLDLSVASIGAAIWYMSSQKGTITCMNGMMIGMTIAMQAGMMIGAVVGGTNGFFTGAMVGMTIAVVAGTLTGATGGIMGAVQGMMSGIMAGTMGAMITVMMFTDRVFVFMPYYMILNVLVLIGLIYLYYEEVVEGKKNIQKKNYDFMTFASACIIVTSIITAIMLYGPKSPLFG